MKQLNVRVDEKTYEIIKALCDFQGYTQSELIRIAIKDMDDFQTEKNGIDLKNSFERIIESLAELKEENANLRRQNELLLSEFKAGGINFETVKITAEMVIALCRTNDAALNYYKENKEK